jgi:hypothetical protein
VSRQTAVSVLHESAALIRRHKTTAALVLWQTVFSELLFFPTTPNMSYKKPADVKTALDWSKITNPNKNSTPQKTAALDFHLKHPRSRTKTPYVRV